jgi:tRNA (cmo5U34)-methyltransferase
MQTPAVDQTRPAGRWAFDEAVTGVFDDMLARSVPQYAEMRRACFELGSRYVVPQTDIVDLGCSRGEALAPFVERFGAGNRLVGVEVSQPMLRAARERFAGYLRCGVVEVRDCDLRTGYPPVRASLTLAVLTLQFTPIEYRQRIVRDVWKHTAPGGAFLLVEKVLGASADLDRAMVELYYGLKAANGYSADEIERKRLALEGVLVPVTARWNEELLRAAGFGQVDGFWRWMNFAGWVAVKE